MNKKATRSYVVDDDDEGSWMNQYNSEDEEPSKRTAAQPQVKKPRFKPVTAVASTHNRRQPANDSGDLSPPRPSRKSANDGDISPPRRRVDDVDEDMEVPRRRADDLSPPRQRKPNSGPITQQSTGTSQPQTIYRDISGRKVDMEAIKAQKANEEQERIRAQKEMEEYRRGTAQKREAEEYQRQLDKLKHEKFARYDDDEELNKKWKSREHWDDPLKRGQSSNNNANSGSSRPAGVSKHHAPPNRFGILPGIQWDGIDRSNGFEKEWFKQKYAREMKKKTEYEYAVEDM